MKNKIINLAYLKMNFTAVLNCNQALTITSRGCDPVGFENWLDIMEMSCDIYCDLKEFGLDVLTITYESGIKITITL